MFYTTFFAITFSWSEQHEHIIPLSMIEQKPHRHLMKIKRQKIHVATIFRKIFGATLERSRNL